MKKYLFFILIISLFSCTNSNEDILDEYLEYINRGKLGYIEQYIDSNDFVYIASFDKYDSLNKSCKLNSKEFFKKLESKVSMNLEKGYTYLYNEEDTIEIISEEKDIFSEYLKFEYPKYYETYYFKEGLITKIEVNTGSQHINRSNSCFRKIKKFKEWLKINKEENCENLSSTALTSLLIGYKYNH